MERGTIFAAIEFQDESAVGRNGIGDPRSDF